MKGELTVTLPSDREIALTREFNAPKNLVYDAMTKPELLRRWFGGAPGWTLETCEIDLRPGGKYRYVWSGPGGEGGMGMGGVYWEIVPYVRITSTEKFDESWYEGDAESSLDFTEKDGRTTLVTTVKYASREVRDAVLKSPMKEGMSHGFDVLEDFLATLPR